MHLAPHTLVAPEEEFYAITHAALVALAVRSPTVASLHIVGTRACCTAPRTGVAGGALTFTVGGHGLAATIGNRYGVADQIRAIDALVDAAKELAAPPSSAVPAHSVYLCVFLVCSFVYLPEGRLRMR